MRALPKSLLLLLSAFTLLATACGPQPTSDAEMSGPEMADELVESDAELAASQRAVVFTLSNEPENAVIAFRREVDGALTKTGVTLTGGQGSGNGLGSQGALAFSRNRRWLFAVNAGSNQISSFEVYGTALVLADVEGSGGERPVSITSHGNLVYVVNAGGSGNITGFTMTGHGRLVPIHGSTRPLSSANAAPAQIEFTPDGTRLVVTEKATNRISTYTVGPDGTTVGPLVTESSGMTPFGFAFTRDQLLVVSEAFGGEAGRSATSSYWVSARGQARVVSGSVPNGQGAACWAVITRNGDHAFISNTASGSISSYRIDSAGALQLRADGGRTGTTGEGSRPADMALSAQSSFLYVLNVGTHTIGAFRVSTDGGLTPIPGVSGLPASAVGLVAR